MAELTNLETKLGEVIGLAMAAQAATERVEKLTDDRTLAATLKLVAAEQAKAGSGVPTPTQIPAAALGNIAVSNGRSMVVTRLDQPLRLRRLWVNNEKNDRDESFRGVLLVSGGDGDPSQGFEDVPADRAVLITRDLQVQLADLNP